MHNTVDKSLCIFTIDILARESYKNMLVYDNKKVRNIFPFSIDKMRNICYNIITVKER